MEMPSTVTMILAAFFLQGCVTITNSIGNQPVPGVGVVTKKKVKSKASKAIDYEKIQEMIATAIAEAIDERLSSGPLVDITYPELSGAANELE